MNKRDLKADLEIVESMNRCLEDSGDFVREVVLPHALKRAIAAEEEVEKLKKQLQASRDSVYGISCEADEARHERNELEEEVERLREALTSIKSTCKLGVYPMMSDDIVRIVDSAIQRIQEGMEHE